MSKIESSNVIQYSTRGATLVDGLPSERRVTSEEQVSVIDKGTVLIDAFEISYMALGNDRFATHGDGEQHALSGPDSVELPAYIVVGPGLQADVNGGTVLTSEAQFSGSRLEFDFVDAAGNLFLWEDTDGMFDQFRLRGTLGATLPVFPVLAWT